MIPDDEQQDQSERGQLVLLIATHGGNLSAIGKALGISRQAVARRLERHHLTEEADSMRAQTGVKGRRSTLRHGTLDPEGERENLLDAMATEQTYEGAAKRVGISRRMLFRKIRTYKITKHAVSRRRSLLKKQGAAS